MTINDFFDLIQYTSGPSIALSEIFCALLRCILSDSHSVHHITDNIPKHVYFSYQPKVIASESAATSSMDTKIDYCIDTMDYDTSTNALKLFPLKLHIQIINAQRYQPILRGIIMRLSPIQRLRKAVSQIEYAEISIGQTKDRRMSRRLSLTAKYLEDKVSSNDEKQAIQIELVESYGRNQNLRDKDAILAITSDVFEQLKAVQEATYALEKHEMHELPLHQKLTLLKTLRDSCLETESMRELLEKNEQERTTKIASIQKEIRDQKAAIRETSQAKREQAIAACKKKNALALKASQTKSTKSGRSTRVIVVNKKIKTIEPTAGQIQNMLEDMVMMESYGIDEVVPSVQFDGSDSDDDDTSQSNRRSSGRLSKDKSKNEVKLKAIDDANEMLQYALQTESMKNIKSAIKFACKSGLRWEENGKVFITELLKQV